MSSSFRERLETSIQQQSIYCCPESDAKLGPQPIGRGAYGVVYKATIKRRNGIRKLIKTVLRQKSNIYSGETVAVKKLYQYNDGDCEENLRQQFVKEVVTYFFCHSSPTPCSN